MRQTTLLVIFTVLISGIHCANLNAQPKRLAPGVLKVIPANIDARDSYSLPMPLEGIQAEAFTPNYAPILNTLHGQTKNVVFFRNVWQYEFGFTGLRQIKLRLTDSVNSPNGAENVWYMVYRIRNTGKNISYEKVQKDQRFEKLSNQIKRDSEDFKVASKFIPHFYLNGWVKKPGTSQYNEVRYRDQIYPEALRLIRQAEDRNRFLLDKIELMSVKVPRVKTAADDGIWGVAIWRNVDPNIDFVNVNITGLTNAYRIETTADGTRNFRYRNLQLNFWRPGDSVRQAEDQVSYGIPLVDDPIRQIEICNRYKLPGPLIRGYLTSKSADQNVLAVEMDADIQFSTFKSTITPTLDQGKVPEKILRAFQISGIQIAPGASVNTSIKERKWTLSGKYNGEDVALVIQVEPQYWEPEGEKIRFINSLDNLWKYR